jgi:hypothetical protein
MLLLLCSGKSLVWNDRCLKLTANVRAFSFVLSK